MTTLNALFNSPITIAVSLTLGFVVGRFRVYQLQNQGETAVRRTIAKAFGAPDYHMMNSVTVPTRDGTTQIDHILVSRFGIFVIETKHYGGAVYATPTAATWTQAFAKSKFKFQNPIFQNYKHIKAIQSLLHFLPADAVHSVVVFTGDAQFKTPRPEGVFLLSEVVSHIKGFNTDVLTREHLESCVGRIECRRLALTRHTDVEHRTRLKRKFG